MSVNQPPRAMLEGRTKRCTSSSAGCAVGSLVSASVVPLVPEGSGEIGGADRTP